MAPPANSVHVVRGEAAMVVSCMRRNARWAPGSAEEQDPLLRNFSTLKQTLSSVKCEPLAIAAHQKSRMCFLLDGFACPCPVSLGNNPRSSGP